jgi:raffinose/stachyose/melibiose transport system permease protein
MSDAHPIQSNSVGSRTGPGRWIVFGVINLFLVLVLSPFLLAASNAIKSGVDYSLHGPLALPQSFDLSSIIRYWNDVDFTRKLANSLIVSGGVAAGAVFLGLLNAYAIGIGRVRFGRPILVLILISIMVPQESLVFPLYYMTKVAGIYNTLISVILIFTVLQSAYGTYLLVSVLTAFPRDIIEAAEIDGASRWQILWWVVVPLLRPTLAVLATFFFIWTWNEFLLPLVFLVSNDNQTVSVALGSLNGEHILDPTRIAAAALLGMTPTLIFFLIFQRTLTRGVVVGAIK